jgi:hypothetical protein
MGYKPFFLDQIPENQRGFTPPLDIFKYFEYLKLVNPTIAFVTLSDSLFNRCKSNIAWIEATYAGAVTVCPDWDVWELPGVLHYQDIHSFEWGLNSAMSFSDQQFQEAYALSLSFMLDTLRLSKINQLRSQLLHEVLS